MRQIAGIFCRAFYRRCFWVAGVVFLLVTFHFSISAEEDKSQSSGTGSYLGEGGDSSHAALARDQLVNDLKRSLNEGFLQIQEMRKKLEEITRPAVNILKGISDRDFVQAAADFLNQSNWSLFWWSQATLFFLILLMRLWLTRWPKSWYQRLWLDLWSMSLYLFLLLIAVPLLVLGEPYRRIVKSIWSIYMAE